MKYLVSIIGVAAMLGVVTAGVAAIHNDGIAVGKLQQKSLHDKAIADLKVEYDEKMESMRAADLKLLKGANERVLALESDYSKHKNELAVNDAAQPEKLEMYRTCKLDAYDLRMLQRSGFRSPGSGVGTDTNQPINTSIFITKETTNRVIARIPRSIPAKRKAVLYRAVYKSVTNRSAGDQAARYRIT